MEQLAGLPRVLPLLLGDHDQRMGVGSGEAPVSRQLVGGFLRNQPIGYQVVQYLLQIEFSVFLSGGDIGLRHDGPFSAATISATSRRLNGLQALRRRGAGLALFVCATRGDAL